MPLPDPTLVCSDQSNAVGICLKPIDPETGKHVEGGADEHEYLMPAFTRPCGAEQTDHPTDSASGNHPVCLLSTGHADAHVYTRRLGDPEPHVVALQAAADALSAIAAQGAAAAAAKTTRLTLKARRAKKS